MNGLRATETEAGSEQVAVELPIAITVNGIAHAVMMATPLDLDDFAMGFALSEGLIDAAPDLLDVEPVQGERGLSLMLTVREALAQRLKHQRRSLAGRTGCGLCGIERLDALPAAPRAVLAPVLIEPPERILNRAMQALLEAQHLNQRCGGLHAAGLFDAHGGLLAVREDVGRHNALDKVIGAALWAKRRGQEPVDQSWVAVSSRASYEMVHKSACAGYGLLASISAPTSLAIDTAKACGLALYGFVREGRATRYA